jgi:hypothetical protein
MALGSSDALRSSEIDVLISLNYLSPAIGKHGSQQSLPASWSSTTAQYRGHRRASPSWSAKERRAVRGDPALRAELTEPRTELTNAKAHERGQVVDLRPITADDAA